MIYNIDNLRVLKAKSVHNLNDKQMFLLRGGPLDEIDRADQNTLTEKYNLKTVIDFRSSDERKKAPNVIMEGVDYYNIEVMDPQESIQKNPLEFLKAYKLHHDLNFMEHMYSEFVLNAYTRNSYKEFLETVSKSKGSVYFHCTAGKDRTGFASMLLLEILGATEEEIFKDYLKTNDFTNDNFELILIKVREVYENVIADDILKDMIGVKEEYLNISRNLIFDKYKSVNDFIRIELKVDDKTLDMIRRKFVV